MKPKLEIEEESTSIGIDFTEEELKRLDRLAKKAGVGKNQFLRDVINREFFRLEQVKKREN